MHACHTHVRFPTAQRKQRRKAVKKIPCYLGKTQGIWKLYAEVVNSIILKMKDIAIFAVKISDYFLGTEFV